MDISFCIDDVTATFFAKLATKSKKNLSTFAQELFLYGLDFAEETLLATEIKSDDFQGAETVPYKDNLLD